MNNNIITLVAFVVIMFFIFGCSTRTIIKTEIPCPSIPSVIRLSDNDLRLLDNRTYSILAENDMKLSNWIRKVRIFCR